MELEGWFVYSFEITNANDEDVLFADVIARSQDDAVKYLIHDLENEGCLDDDDVERFRANPDDFLLYSDPLRLPFVTWYPVG